MAGNSNAVGERVAQNNTSRVSILQSINKPLTFFALVVLVTEVILLAVIKNSEGTTTVILASGMVCALIVAIFCVFVFVKDPKTRPYFLVEPYKFGADITEVRLSNNDYRFLYAISKRSNLPASSYKEALKPPSSKTLEARVKDLVLKDFLQTQYPKDFGSELQLTEKGRVLAHIINTVESALTAQDFEGKPA